VSASYFPIGAGADDFENCVASNLHGDISLTR
jgi:hypothetical protein